MSAETTTRGHRALDGTSVLRRPLRRGMSCEPKRNGNSDTMRVVLVDWASGLEFNGVVRRGEMTREQNQGRLPLKPSVAIDASDHSRGFLRWAWHPICRLECSRGQAMSGAGAGPATTPNLGPATSDTPGRALTRAGGIAHLPRPLLDNSLPFSIDDERQLGGIAYVARPPIAEWFPIQTPESRQEFRDGNKQPRRPSCIPLFGRREFERMN